MQTAVGLIQLPLVSHVARKLPEERYAVGIQAMLQELPAGKFEVHVPGAVLALKGA